MQRISINPSSPTKGSTYDVCYDFSGLDDSVQSVTLKGTHSPPHPDDPVWITINRPTEGDTACQQVTAPTNATGVLWVDVTNGSKSAGAIFQNP